MSQNLLKSLKTLSPVLLAQRHPVFVTQKATKLIVYERDKKGDCDTEIETTHTEQIKKGFQIIRKGIPQFKNEVMDFMACDHFFFALHGDYEYFWKFNGKESLEDWVVTSDQNLKKGYSRAALDVTPNNKAVFHGEIDTRVPKDGMQKKAGFVNLRSPFNTMAFNRKIPYDWSRYTHLYIRCRGDGRAYQMNVKTQNEFDVMWHDLFVFPLHTRGGPYWQIAKIPLSKFFLTAAGRIQDKQASLVGEAHKISTLSFTLADEVEGSFKLEFDYIALIRDETHDEEFAYEMYKDSPYQIGN